MTPRTIISGFLLLGSVALFAQEKKAAQPMTLANVSSDDVPHKKAARKVNPLHTRSIERNPSVLIDRESNQADKALGASNQVLAEVRAFPNPFTSQIDIIITEGAMNRSEYRATLYDVAGKKVHSSELMANQSSLELSQLSTGIYFLHVEKNGLLIKSEKFVKE